MGSVFIGIPSFDGRVEFATAVAAFQGTSRQVHIQSGSSSLLAFGFNGMWCEALNARAEQDVEWFAMLHADIIPEGPWIDTLIAEAEKHDADVMSAVVPFKAQSGYTSTAFSDPADPWVPFCRLTQAQVNSPTFPPTFDAPIASSALRALPSALSVAPPKDSLLLVNTGCFVARLAKPWAEQIRFTIQDRIHSVQGKFIPNVQPEDWTFSRDVHALGGKVMATTKVHLKHRGPSNYDSRQIWGANRDHLLK